MLLLPDMCARGANTVLHLIQDLDGVMAPSARAMLSNKLV